MRLDPAIIQHQVNNLLVAYPELAEDDALRADMIEGETEAFDFLARLVRMIDDTRALSEGTELRLRDLQARRERLDRRIDAYRNLAFKIMQTADIQKAELPEATLSIRKGTPKVIITNETALPDIACKLIRKPDLTKIKELLTDEAGVCAGAQLSNAEPTLAIRVK